MRNKDYIKNSYRHFGDFVAISSASELGHLVLDARYTSGFSFRMKQILSDIRDSGRLIAEFSILFNTQGDIAIIDADIIGRFIADRYCAYMEDYYKNTPVNKIVKSVINGSEKVKMDFVDISYSILYETLDEIYMVITCKRDLLNNMKESFNIAYYNEEDVGAVIGVLMILEDICKYMGINQGYVREIAHNRLKQKDKI
jgi:hypothetical protein